MCIPSACDGKNKALLGGKGADLCEMTQIGLTRLGFVPCSAPRVLVARLAAARAAPLQDDYNFEP